MSTITSTSQIPPSPSSSSVLSKGSTVSLTKEHPPPLSSLKGTNGEKGNKGPLTADLRRILTQVARHGRCPWLGWNGDTTATTSGAATKNSSLAANKQSSLHNHHLNLHHHHHHHHPLSQKQHPRRRVFHRKRPRSSSSPGAASASTSKNNATKTSSSAACANPSSAAPSRSGSELDGGASAYECDSEGTSASELSVNQQHIVVVVDRKYATLSRAFSVAMGLVLDHMYATRGGYKLSPAELHARQEPIKMFQQRRQKLVAMVVKRNGPPFTIQRLAEVLLAPERYYTQTHKLCNCLEKLLLVTSSIDAFGGSTGGDTNQSRREDREMAALADERERQESEQRNRRLRRRLSVSSDGDELTHQNKDGQHETTASPTDLAKMRQKIFESPGGVRDSSLAPSAATANHQLSQHLSQQKQQQQLKSSNNVDVPNRSMSSSPPPPPQIPSSPTTATSNGIPIQVANFVRHIQEQQHASPHREDLLPHPHPQQQRSVARAPSPILFSPNSNPSSSTTSTTNNNSLLQQQHPTNHSMHLLQMHHAAALADVRVGAGKKQQSGTPLDIVIDPTQQQQQQVHGTTTTNSAASHDFGDAEVDRSSASDSESDDVSLDDSASDRSDGSDTSSSYNNEPFTAARVMTLNRLQQRNLMVAAASASSATAAYSFLSPSLSSSMGQPKDGNSASGGTFRPADADYQSSGDSIDSMMAEDSGGSDSSSSDLAD